MELWKTGVMDSESGDKGDDKLMWDEMRLTGIDAQQDGEVLLTNRVDWKILKNGHCDQQRRKQERNVNTKIMITVWQITRIKRVKPVSLSVLTRGSIGTRKAYRTLRIMS